MTLSRRDILKAQAVAAATAAAGIALPADAANVIVPNDEAQMKWNKAPCRFCGTGCCVMVGVKDGRVVATHGDVQHVVNRGLNCVKGYFLSKIMYGADRLTTPYMILMPDAVGRDIVTARRHVYDAPSPGPFPVALADAGGTAPCSISSALHLGTMTAGRPAAAVAAATACAFKMRGTTSLGVSLVFGSIGDAVMEPLRDRSSLARTASSSPWRRRRRFRSCWRHGADPQPSVARTRTRSRIRARTTPRAGGARSARRCRWHRSGAAAGALADRRQRAAEARDPGRARIAAVARPPRAATPSTSAMAYGTGGDRRPGPPRRTALSIPAKPGASATWWWCCNGPHFVQAAQGIGPGGAGRVGRRAHPQGAPRREQRVAGVARAAEQAARAPTAPGRRRGRRRAGRRLLAARRDSACPPWRGRGLSLPRPACSAFR